MHRDSKIKLLDVPGWVPLESWDRCLVPHLKMERTGGTCSTWERAWRLWKGRQWSFCLERRELRGGKCLQVQANKETDLFWHQGRKIKLMGTYAGQLRAQRKKMLAIKVVQCCLRKYLDWGCCAGRALPNWQKLEHFRILGQPSHFINEWSKAQRARLVTWPSVFCHDEILFKWPVLWDYERPMGKTISGNTLRLFRNCHTFPFSLIRTPAHGTFTAT